MAVLFKHKWNRRIVRVVSLYFLLSTLVMCIALIPETKLLILLVLYYISAISSLPV